ncbi:caspase family protein [Candidatus Marinimicrobia bacterium]|nr:caspase family protein [Candidatus Neomarinimicrobiota bacterium]
MSSKRFFQKNGWLAKHSNKKSDIFIFYAGHGAPNIETGTSYLIPYDIDPNYSTTGYSLDKLYNNLGNVKSKSITVILDACFSGGTRENQSLLSNARPVYIEVQKGNIPSNIIVFTAASGKEISSGYKQKSHGIFTYYFLKGLKGEADSNEDKKISNLEMYNYLGENVLIQARRIGREQNPQLLGGSEDKILLTY